MEKLFREEKRSLTQNRFCVWDQHRVSKTDTLHAFNHQSGGNEVLGILLGQYGWRWRGLLGSFGVLKR